MTTADAGAPQGADVSASSAQPTETPTLSMHERMLQTAETIRQKVEASHTPTEQRPGQANSSPTDAVKNDAGNTDAPGTDAKKPIPYAAFQERLAREKSKQEEIKATLATKDFELTRTLKALEMVQAEYERVSAQLRVDPQTDELNRLRLNEQARVAFEKLNADNQAKQAQAQEQAAMQEKRAAYRAVMDEAIFAYPDVTFDELKSQILATQNSDAKAVAKAISDKRRAYYGGAPSRTPVPPVIRGNTSVNARNPSSHQGMVEFANSILAKHQK